MQILKKKYILTTNNFNNYLTYLKNLNFLNKLKKKEKIILKDNYILNLKNFYLLNLNSKENLFHEKINLNNFNYNNKNILYIIIKNKNEKDLLINFNFITYFILNLYTSLLFKKLKKYKIKKFYIKTNKNKEIFYKKIRNFYPYIKGRIIKYKNLKKKKRKNKKFLIISFLSLIQQLKSYELYKKKKNLFFIKNFYLKKRYIKKTQLKYLFKKYRKNIKNFKINILKTKNLKFDFSRKAYVFDFNKINKNYNLKKNYNLYNLNFLKKYSKIFIEK